MTGTSSQRHTPSPDSSGAQLKSWTQPQLFGGFRTGRTCIGSRRADSAKNSAGGRLLLAGGLVFDDRGRVLLLHRNTPTATWWETPGGKVDPGENPREAAARELEEELGVSVRVVRDLGWHDFFTEETPMRYAIYQMEVVSGELKPREEKFDSACFFSWSKLCGMSDELSPNTKVVLERRLGQALAVV